RRPAAIEDGPTAHRVCEARKTEARIGTPRQSPHLVHSADQRKVLNVLREREWPTFEHEHAVAMALVLREEVLGDDAAKGATAEDDDVEGPGVFLAAAIRSGSSGVNRA